jgi:hypothetical protein
MENNVQLSPIVQKSGQVHHRQNGKGLNRLIAAAVINSQFCDVLLKDPEKAVKNGFSGEYFSLDHKEKSILFSIKASNLAEFAMQVVNLQNGQTQKRGEHGGGYWFPENSAMVTMEPK